MDPKIIPLFLVISHLTTGGGVYGNTYDSADYERVKLVYPKTKYNFLNKSYPSLVDGRTYQRHFNAVYDDSTSSAWQRKMSKPVRSTTESSFFDFFDGKDDGNDEDYDDYEDRKKAGMEKPPKLRGIRRKYVKAHKIIFPLLMAYKLKFFTMLPLLVGSLVLLIGTTGIAGFFFALFSAALGLQVKSHHG